MTLLFLVVMAISTLGREGDFLERAAVRKLCSTEERNRWKAFDEGSGEVEDVEMSLGVTRREKREAGAVGDADGGLLTRS